MSEKCTGFHQTDAFFQDIIKGLIPFSVDACALESGRFQIPLIQAFYGISSKKLASDQLKNLKSY